MQFTPKTDKELNNIALFQRGNYDFVVMDAQELLDKNGILRIHDDSGRERNVQDYLSDYSSFHYKIKHFCECTGIEHKYLAGTLEVDDCINKKGKLKLSIKIDKTGQYNDKNVVQDYIKGDANTDEVKLPFNDDIPF